MICVSESELEIILDILRTYIPDGEARVFGSRYKWTPKEYSDLDIAIVGKEKMGFRLLGDMRNAFEESTLPYRVDVLDWFALTPEFQAIIEQGYEMIYSPRMDRGNNWPRVWLGDAPLEIIDGDRGKNYPSQNDFFEEEYCLFLNTKNVRHTGFDFSSCQFITEDRDKLLRKGKLKKNDIVLTTRGTIGNIAFYDDTIPFENIRINSGMVIIRPDETKLFPRFNYYLFRKLQDDFPVFTTGSAQPQLPIKDLIKLSATIPPLPTQRAIAATLSCLDDKIELNNRINANLEAQAQAIFKSWFVDFEPWGGVIPDDWREGTFSDLISTTLGGDWGKDAPTGNNTQEVYCIRGADIPEVNVGNRGKMPIRYILSKNYVSKQLTVGDVVVEISGGSPTQSTGRCALITQSLLDRYDRGMVCTNFCRAVKPIPEYSAFVYFYWKYLYTKNVMFAYENGTTGIKNLDFFGFLSTEPIVIPPKGVVTGFTQTVSIFIDTIFANGLESEILANTRDALIPRLMSGEIEVKEA
jgi:type I restriction enzyme S subunit